LTLTPNLDENMTAQHVEQAVAAVELKRNVTTMVIESGLGDANVAAELSNWVTSIAEDFLTLLREIDHPEQIDATTAIQYIEIKSHWIALNTKMNYQLARQGQADPMVILKGAAISQFLGALEPLINPGDIEAITDFLSEPLDKTVWTGASDNGASAVTEAA